MTSGRTSRRTRTLDLTPIADDRYAFTASLIDQASGGDYGPGAASEVVVHHFEIAGQVSGRELRLDALDVTAEEHPFPECPLILSSAQELLGLSVLKGWRQAVLSRLRGAAGCTHVTTLLLGLSELTTLAYFQDANLRVPYGASTRASGEWIATNLDLHPGLAGACHALRADGAVVGAARRFQGGAGSDR